MKEPKLEVPLLGPALSARHTQVGDLKTIVLDLGPIRQISRCKCTSIKADRYLHTLGKPGGGLAVKLSRHFSFGTTGKGNLLYNDLTSLFLSKQRLCPCYPFVKIYIPLTSLRLFLLVMKWIFW